MYKKRTAEMQSFECFDAFLKATPAQARGDTLGITPLQCLRDTLGETSQRRGRCGRRRCP